MWDILGPAAPSAAEVDYQFNIEMMFQIDMEDFANLNTTHVSTPSLLGPQVFFFGDFPTLTIFSVTFPLWHYFFFTSTAVTGKKWTLHIGK